MTEREIDAAYRAAVWWKGVCDSSNRAFLPLFADEHRYLVLKGGGGSGKSIFAGRKVLERMMSEKGHRFLVCRKVQKTLRESCWRQLVEQAREHYAGEVANVNKTDMTITFRNGNVILFAGLDDVEKLKSIYNVTGIWIEEASELAEGDFNQLDIRLRGKTENYKQIILTFNPVSALHWLKKRFWDRRDPEATIHESTYKDNRFLDAEAVRVLEGFKDTDEYYYTVYCLGQWGTTGRSIFNASAVSRRLAEGIKPEQVGYFTYSDDGLRIGDIAFTEDSQGYVRIYKPPEKGVPYVIGGDTAGDGSDAFVGQVIDNRTGEQVAILRHTFDEDLYARQMYALGMWYNTALIAVETNYSTYPVRELERLRYPRQYVRESVDDFTHKIRQSYGFETTSKTRPLIISELTRAVREDITLVRDETTLGEMLTFVRNEAFRPEAEEGAHDDCVMALAIAHFVRPHQKYTKDPEQTEGVAWTEDQWEDYRAADAETKKYLRSKWGEPRRF